MEDYNVKQSRINLDSKLKNTMLNRCININEYLLNPENNRLTIYPIKNEAIWKSYKKQQAAFWTAEEIDFSKDYDNFCNLNDNEQHFIKMILAFFSSSDTIVNINLSERFLQDIKIREAIVAYTWQMMMESTHSETYSLQIDNIVRDSEEKDKLLNAVIEYSCIAEKAAWAVKWIESTESFAHRLLAFAVVEGVFFSGSFCSIFWLKKRNIMPGLCASNELIARDEGMHCDFAVHLHNNHIINKVSQDRIKEILTSALEIEKEFITESLPVRLIGMNSELMIQYLEFVTDRLLLDLGCSRVYNSENPFDFMANIALQGKTNFFEKRVGEYQKAGIMNKNEDDPFGFDADF